MDKRSLYTIKVIKEKSFWRDIALFFIMECVFGILVKIKNGNMDAYIALLLPMLLIITIFYAYASHKQVRKLFIMSCMMLFMIGTMMQCIVQNEAEDFALKQQINMMISLIATVAFLILYQRFFKNMEKTHLLRILFLSAVVFYFILIFVGHDAGDGTKAWIKLAGISLQLTEFMKIITVLFFTAVFCNEEWNDKKKFYVGLAYLTVNGILSLFVKEMGSFLVMGIVFMLYAILFLNAPKYILSLTGIGVLCGGIGLFSGKMISSYVQKKLEAGIEVTGLLAKISHEYDLVLTRLNTWINPELVSEAARNQGYRAQQGMAIGGLFGNKIKSNVFIPVASSDFIFPEIIMNLGLIFGIVIVLFFMVFLIIGSRMYLEQDDYKNMGLITGAVYYITVQSFLMVFGSTGFFIMTGVPVSFISSGGTTMMVTFILTALIIASNEMDMDDVYAAGEDLSDDVIGDNKYVEREL